MLARARDEKKDGRGCTCLGVDPGLFDGLPIVRHQHLAPGHRLLRRARDHLTRRLRTTNERGEEGGAGGEGEHAHQNKKRVKGRRDASATPRQRCQSASTTTMNRRRAPTSWAELGLPKAPTAMCTCVRATKQTETPSMVTRWGSLTEGMFLKPLTNRAPNDAAMFPQKPRGLPPRGLHDRICRALGYI